MRLPYSLAHMSSSAKEQEVWPRETKQLMYLRFTVNELQLSQFYSLLFYCQIA